MAKEKEVEIKGTTVNVKEAKLQALEKARLDCEKEFGKNSIMKMDGSSIQKVPCISTGILGIDLALGNGFPKGRLIEILGMESSSKTTLCLHTAAEIQKNNGTVAIIDSEHALDIEYAKNLGVNVDELYLAQPESGEVSLSIAEKFIESGVDLLIIDSVAALTPQAEIENDMGSSNMGLHARLMSQACRKLTAKASKSGTTVIFTNQYRQTIGPFSTFVGTGGNALKFWTSVRLEMKKAQVEKVEEGEDASSGQIKLKVIKNKVSPPYRKIEERVVFGKGIDKYYDLITLGVKHDIIKKAGAWLSISIDGKEERWQGMDNACVALEKDESIFTIIKDKIKEIVNKENKSDSIHVKTPKEETPV